MGDAFTAVADDLNALTWNPAGLSQLRRKEAAFMHAELFADTRFDFLGYAHPLGAQATLALGLARLSQGAIAGRDDNRQPTGSYDASDTALQLAYSRQVPGVEGRVGAGVKFLQSTIADASARSFALDLGYLQQVQAGALPLSLGVAALNLGPGMRFLGETDDLPLTLSAGVGLRLFSSVLLAADFRQRPRAGGSEFGLGTEYLLLPALTLRAGYTLGGQPVVGPAGGFLNGLQGMGMGLGFRLGSTALDYSFQPSGQLGAAQRISLSARF